MVNLHVESKHIGQPALQRRGVSVFADLRPRLRDLGLRATLCQRLDLAAARVEVETAAYAWRLKQRTRHLPGVNVGMNAERDRDGSWVLGPTLDLELPVFDQGQPELARLSAHYRQARHRYEALATNIRSEVREARDALQAAREVALSHQNELLPQYRRQLAETLLHYNAMQISSQELLLAKQREQQAEQAAIEALRDYWIARARFQAALGGGISPASPTPIPPPPVPAPASAEHNHRKH